MGYSLTLASAIIFSFFLFSFYMLFGALQEVNNVTQSATLLREKKEYILKNTQITLDDVTVEGKNVTFRFKNTGTTPLDADYITFLVDDRILTGDNLNLTLEKEWETHWQVGETLEVRAYLPTLSLSDGAREPLWFTTPPLTTSGNLTLAAGRYIYCLISNSTSPEIVIYTRGGEIVGSVTQPTLHNPLDIHPMGEDLLVMNHTEVDLLTPLGYMLKDGFITSLADAEHITSNDDYIFISIGNGSIYRYTTDGKNRSQIYKVNSTYKIMDIQCENLLHLFLKTADNFFWIYNLTVDGVLKSRMNLSAALSFSPLAISYFPPTEQLVVLTENDTSSYMISYFKDNTFHTINTTLLHNPAAIAVKDGIYISSSDFNTVQKISLGFKVKVTTMEGWEGVWEF